MQKRSPSTNSLGFMNEPQNFPDIETIVEIISDQLKEIQRCFKAKNEQLNNLDNQNIDMNKNYKQQNKMVTDLQSKLNKMKKELEDANNQNQNQDKLLKTLKSKLYANQEKLEANEKESINSQKQATEELNYLKSENSSLFKKLQDFEEKYQEMVTYSQQQENRIKDLSVDQGKQKQERKRLVKEKRKLLRFRQNFLAVKTFMQENINSQNSCQ